MDLPNRKTMRLPDYDYNQNGAYFITICTKNREPLLSRVYDGNAVDVRDVEVIPLIGEMSEGQKGLGEAVPPSPTV